MRKASLLVLRATCCLAIHATPAVASTEAQICRDLRKTMATSTADIHVTCISNNHRDTTFTCHAAFVEPDGVIEAETYDPGCVQAR